MIEIWPRNRFCFENFAKTKWPPRAVVIHLGSLVLLVLGCSLRLCNHLNANFSSVTKLEFANFDSSSIHAIVLYIYTMTADV